MRSRRNLRSDQFLRGDFCGLGGEPCSWQAEHRHMLDGLLRESSQVLLDECSCMIGTGGVWLPGPASPGGGSYLLLVGESVEWSEPKLLRPDVFLMPEEEWLSAAS